MSIKIAERLRPFSHVPGVCCLLPKTKVTVQAFPTLIRFLEIQDIELELEGPVQDFTVQQDLERGHLSVYGHAKNGYFRYVISQENEGIFIRFQKFPLPKETIFIPHLCREVAPCKERLSLGNHKAQDWEMMRRRADLKEIFPLWVKLANLTPNLEVASHPLLSCCEEQVAMQLKVSIYSTFSDLFKAGFYDMLVPRFYDTQHQGFALPVETDTPPHFILKQGGALIRSLFFQEDSETLSLLPCLPPEFHAGRYLNIKTSHGEEIDIEWSKKMLKRVLLRPSSPRSLRLHLPKVKSFRVRTSLQDRGYILTPEDLLPTTSIPLILDRFQK